MNDDRPRDPGATDGPYGEGPGSAPHGSGGDQGGPSFSLDKGDDAGRGVSYGYGAPTYGGSSDRAEGNSFDANRAQGPTTEDAYDPHASAGWAPPGGSGYDPNAGGGYGGGSTPPPYGSPSPYGPPPKATSSNKGLYIGLAVGAVVVLLVAIGGIALIATRGGGDGEPSATVKTYLQALADGDAAKALDQGEKPPDATFVTSDALKAQQEMAKISSIEVSEGYSSSRSARVSATYRFGDKQADESFSLTKIGGDWKLDDTTYAIDLTYLDDVPGLTLMGIAAEGKSKAYVFPGPLQWGSSNEYLSVEERDADDFTLSPADGRFSFSSLEAGLSDKGEQAVADAVTTYITECAKAKDLTPDNCPQREYDYQGVDGSATWTPPSDLGSLEYRTSTPATEVYVSGDLTWSVTYTAQDSAGAQTPKTVSDVDGSIYGTVDLTQDPPVFKD